MLFVAAGLAWLWIPAPDGAIPAPSSPMFWLICGLVLILPLAQLVPLPAGVWTSLAGQDDRAAALALVDAEQIWQPLSHSPSRTLAAVLAMIPALFAFFATASLDARGRLWVAGAIATMAWAASLLGALQVSLGMVSGPYLYAEHSPTLTGFQANRNAAADVLLIGVVAIAAFAYPSLAAQRADGRGPLGLDRRAGGFILAGLFAMLFFAILLTASRTGIALLPLAFAGVFAILIPVLANDRRLRSVPAIAVLAAVLVLALAAWQIGNTALGNVAERFAFSDDGRRELWNDAWFATVEAWPFGVGMGGAQPALIAAERLEVLDPALPNRVHNDYLELALEGGLPALALLAAIALLLLATAWRSWRGRPEDRHLTVLGVVILLVAALHSAVDYPLRSMALACLIGTGAGLLMSIPRKAAMSEASA